MSASPRRSGTSSTATSSRVSWCLICRSRAVPRTIEGNEELHKWLRGAETAHDPEDARERDVRLIDFDDIESNDFDVTQEWTQQTLDGTRNRADVMFCVNGVPIVLVE